MATLLAGAVGALALMLRAGGPNRPLMLVPLFALWDASPFVLLLVADRLSRGWPILTRKVLYYLMFAVAAGTLAAYIADAIWPRTAQAAYAYVIVPPVSWLFIAVGLTMATMVARTRKEA